MEKENLIFKVIEEYERFYVGLSRNGYRECFMKFEYKPDAAGNIHKKHYNQTGPYKEKEDIVFNRGILI